MSSESQVWLITGCSSGIGREIAYAALAAGHKVIATARKPSTLADLVNDGAHGLALDVCAPKEELAKVVEQALAVWGRVDVLVNNAAQIFSGAVEEVSEQDVDNIFRVNLFGPLNLIKIVLPHMRERKSGTIVNVGSVAGSIGMPGVASYCGSKFALTGYTEALNAEVRHLGIRAVYIEPGDFLTNILEPNVKMFRAAHTIPDYHVPGSGTQYTEERLAVVNNTQPGDPKKAGEVIVRVCGGGDQKGVPERLVLGSDAFSNKKAKYESVLKEMEKWEDVSRSTDFESKQTSLRF